ncbi:murein L,D-transpeptidase catalytic domain family protein [Parvularcula flava]|uniref:Murein L,D-transpeptidase catalytic domain family protein n=1 Tax=Aquisalinus luteolus TaxID=1566827 RepID=A0A8J3A5A6_9PROT|nr:murein L,D-transpeptidase catalytic domain family protein [Aquisalinus luteolus]NHK28997.1 murein L,D-transpeptidase catalytic domain family protein [Aquisalinus luteolus]GGI00627.1 hypothetical protein GCM10011355_29370 [Aquisalinus luteolus]
MPITEIVDYGQVQAVGLEPRVLNEAFSARDRYLGDIEDRRYLTIIDFGKPSSEDRLYLLDLVAGTVEAMLVAHGEGSDPDKDGYADRFSPVPNSRMSSLGGYLTADTYYGAHGLSLRLQGLEDTNVTAWDRLIVIHGADYVGRHLAEQGWSWGCPAVEYAKSGPLIEKIKQGTFLYIAGPAPKYDDNAARLATRD